MIRETAGEMGDWSGILSLWRVALTTRHTPGSVFPHGRSTFCRSLAPPLGPRRARGDAPVGIPSDSRRSAGSALCGTVIIGLLIGVAAPSGALPPPPENPSDQQLSDSQAKPTRSARRWSASCRQRSPTPGADRAVAERHGAQGRARPEGGVDLDIANADAQAAADAAATAAADAPPHRRRSTMRSTRRTRSLRRRSGRDRSSGR